MLYSGAYSHEVHVYRKVNQKDTWGELDGNVRPDLPELYGYTFSHTIDEATVTPLSTGIEKSSPENAKRNYTTKAMYCAVDEDVESDDLVVYEDYAGKVQVYEVEGEGSNDYVSPYTGIEAGKELFLGRVRHRN